MLRVVFSSKRVQQQFDALSDDVFNRVDNVIESLKTNPYPRQAKKLAGKKNLYRIRIGDHRLIYSLDHEKNTVVLLRIMHRSTVYKGL